MLIVEWFEFVEFGDWIGPPVGLGSDPPRPAPPRLGGLLHFSLIRRRIRNSPSQIMNPLPPTPAELAHLLATYVHSPSQPDSLTQLLRPARLGVRDDPNLKYASRPRLLLPTLTTKYSHPTCSGSRFEYGQDAAFWASLASVWSAHADLLTAGDESTVASLATLGAFLASLCAQSPRNQQNALYVLFGCGKVFRAAAEDGLDRPAVRQSSCR